ncbi:hypothetical protein L208DRAFT_1412887 [Tricholoma matsutake]|nr:hypothetical protein L208DRAFT_1412887 [Tricholoma matsutake 945]
MKVLSVFPSCPDCLLPTNQLARCTRFWSSDVSHLLFFGSYPLQSWNFNGGSLFSVFWSELSQLLAAYQQMHDV